MKKYYVHHLTHVLEFDAFDFDFKEDDKGLYTEDENFYEWCEELDNSITILEERDVDIRDLRVSEYQDYIDLAEKALEFKAWVEYYKNNI